MEHLIITGGDKLLPFARGRIKALRATGLSHASQSFTVGGISVRVRIEPGHEYIYLTGGIDEYHVTPTSAERLSDTVQYRAGLSANITFSKGGKQGDIDWLSYDGTVEGVVQYGAHMITWSSGLAGRYDPYYAPTKVTPSSNYLWVDGRRFDVGMVPKGACLSSYTAGDGTEATYVVFATLSTSTITIRYFLLDSTTPEAAVSVVAGEYAAPQTADPDWASGYRGHVLFCGRGQKLGALVSTPRSPFSLNGTRFFSSFGGCSC